MFYAVMPNKTSHSARGRGVVQEANQRTKGLRAGFYIGVEHEDVTPGTGLEGLIIGRRKIPIVIVADKLYLREHFLHPVGAAIAGAVVHYDNFEGEVPGIGI